MQRLHPCPCCGYEVFSGAAGSFEICPICFWEDDLFQLTNATVQGGANTVSLREAQNNCERIGACCPSCLSHVRKPSSQDKKDVTWRKWNPVEDRVASGSGTKVQETTPYYWERNSRREELHAPNAEF